MKRAAAKIFPKLLNFEQKHCRMDIGQEMMTTFNDDPDFLKKSQNCQEWKKHVKFCQMW